jgi:hypothetical protein
MREMGEGGIAQLVLLHVPIFCPRDGILSDFCTVLFKASVRMKEGRDAYSVIGGKPANTKPLGRPSHRRQDNIKMNFKDL